MASHEHSMKTRRTQGALLPRFRTAALMLGAVNVGSRAVIGEGRSDWGRVGDYPGTLGWL
jgi:hypothetical protein